VVERIYCKSKRTGKVLKYKSNDNKHKTEDSREQTAENREQTKDRRELIAMCCL
jgi:hypothetical protein